MLKFRKISAPILALALAASAGTAQAATTIVTGSGSVTSTAQSPTATIAAAGAPVSFATRFDPAAATLISTNMMGTSRTYNLNADSIAATIGSHSLNFDPAALQSAVLMVTTAFRFFGGPVSEAILIEDFQFIAGPGGATSPVSLNGLPPTREILAFTFTFRTGTTIVPATIDSLRDPSEAAEGSFFYRADNGTSGAPAAIARGPATGALEVVSPVPEPDTWALMILGLFMTGAMLRRRRAAVVALPKN